jgi:P27 family predicted phage terminase small subunit
MRGRKPKPTRLKELHGNPGKRPLNQNEPKPEPQLPRPPAVIQGAARKEWFRIGRILFDAGLLTAMDTQALVAYCQTYARWCEAEEDIRRSGTVVRSLHDQPMISPYLKVANIAWSQWTHMLTEFGLTPSSRSRVKMPEKGGDDEFEAFLQRGGIRAVPKAKK